jgi:hypothetical protein
MEAAGVAWYLIAKRVVSWTEVTERMTLLDVERCAHAYIATAAMESRAAKREHPKGAKSR